MAALVRLVWVASLVGYCIALASNFAIAEEAEKQSVRGAIQRALPYLEREGVAWMEKRNCISCHQVPSMLWSFHLAGEIGGSVDADKLQKWSDWSLKSALGGNVTYRLPMVAMDSLEQAGLDAAQLEQLRALQAEEFATELEFIAALKDKLTEPVFAKHRDQLLAAATKPAATPGAGATPAPAYVAMLLAAAPSHSSQQTQAERALLDALRRSQQPDGTWKTSSQFNGMNRPQKESAEITTLWILWELAQRGSLPEPVAAARDKAIAAYTKMEPGISTESRLMHLLVSHAQGEQSKAQAHLEQLLKLQREDGGWAFRPENQATDALTTGQVLYGLAQVGLKPDDPSVTRARDYLLSTQTADGPWEAPWLLFNQENNKDHKAGNQVFGYWATGWSIVGLHAARLD